MDPTTLTTYRQRLLQRQAELVQRIYELDGELQGATERCIEYGDKAQAEAPEEVLERLDVQSRQEWEAIHAALERITAGSYGTCEACGTHLPLARLDAMPMARRCLPCQKQSETV